jgi:hypothetical protein
MSNCPFCDLNPESNLAEANSSAPKLSSDKRPIGLFRRAWQGIQWLFPATLLVLMPKCPMCVAAYVALFTGVGVSVSTARWIRILMLAFCLSSMAYLALRYWRRRSKARGFAR